MSLTKNQIEQLPAEVFQNLNVLYALDLSFNNKLSSIPDRAFSGLKQLEVLFLHFNNISKISSLTFAGLQNLRLLMLVNNSLASLPEKALAEMSLNFLFLHGNRIKNVDANAFRGLTDLRLVTLFKNPALTSLPRNVFDGLNENVTLALSCKTLKWLPRGINEATVVCVPTESLFVVVYSPERRYQVDGLLASGFMCSKCSQGGYRRCLNCSLCSTGTYSSCDRANTHCLRCPAGGFYQDEMGQIDCKNCSIGTYVPEINYPGKSATDCRACPYGTQSDKPAGYRACSCLPHFFRLDRFGPCSACEEHGMVCQSDTAILAPKYFWKFNSSEQMNHYKEFVLNIQIFNAGYNRDFSNYRALLPTPIKCPFTDSCNGGIESSCTEGYEGTLCATCTSNHFLRFNRCLECPSMLVTVISCVLVIVVFIILFLLIFWGDSKAANGERGGTAADVVMSCVKIVVGFYQVASGIFSALRQVQWPVLLVSMEKYLKFIEGNILQFAPLSCIDPVFRLDPFIQFFLSISINISVVLLIRIYLFLKRQYIKKLEISDLQKKDEISHLKKSCYRNIFLFLLLSYPITSKKIINVILPLPGVCEDVCFTKDGSDCISLLKADYSISCLSPAYGVYWKLAAVCAIYPLLFPLLLLILLYKYRKPRLDNEICFGFKVFLENYKEKYWFWEIIEMYRKLILISVIFLIDSTSQFQIVCAVIVASGSGIAYSMARPMKGKFEDRLQAFVLWTTFFNVCLGAITMCQNPTKNESIFVNVIFVLLNSAVVLIAVVQGLLYLESNWRNFSSCPVQCFRMMYGRCRDGHRNRRSDLSLIQPLTEERLVFDE